MNATPLRRPAGLARAPIDRPQGCAHADNKTQAQMLIENRPP